MILNATANNAQQTATFNSIQANQPNDGRYWTNPTGLQQVVAAADPAHTYIAYNIANRDVANRTLAYDLDHYSITAGALINAGGHWVDVYGVNTNVQPTLTGNYTVNGFYLKDPAAGGLGRNFYSANTANGWQQLFTPTNFGGSWQGNYAFVADPDPGADPTGSAPAPDANAITSAAQAQAQALADINSSLTGLSSDLSFENGAFSSLGEIEILDSITGTMDWEVPYYQTGDTSTPSGLALINAVTGDLDAAYWDEGVLHGDSLSSLEDFIANNDIGIVNRDNITATPEPGSVGLALASCVTLLPLVRRMHRRRRA